MSRTSTMRRIGVGLLALVVLGAVLWQTGLGGRPTALAGARAPGTSVAPLRRVVTRQPERRTIRRVARIPADLHPWQEVTLASRVTGYVKSISVDVGSRVEARAVVAVLDVPDLEAALEAARSRGLEASARVIGAKALLAAAQASVRQAGSESAAARSTVTRMGAEERKAKADLRYRDAARDRLDPAAGTTLTLVSRDAIDEAHGKADVARAVWEVSSAQVEEARSQVAVAESREASAKARVDAADAGVQEATGADLAARVAVVEADRFLGFATIRAPFAGVVTQRWVDVGDLVRPGTSSDSAAALVRMSDASTLRVRFRVAAPDAPFCKNGNVFRLFVDAIPGRELPCTVARTAETLDVETRTLRAEGDLPNPDGLLRPGMFGRVVLDLETHSEALVVPAEAVTTVKRKSSVLVVQDGKVAKHPIKIGVDDGIWVEILDGLRAEDAVVTLGKDLVSEGEPVEAVPAQAVAR